MDLFTSKALAQIIKILDAVVSLSALEHIPMDQLEKALQEIRRVINDQNFGAITTSATDHEETWHHQPSNGYCYSMSDLENFLKQKPHILKIRNGYFKNTETLFI